MPGTPSAVAQQQQPLTRRQLREAEKARQAVAQPEYPTRRQLREAARLAEQVAPASTAGRSAVSAAGTVSARGGERPRHAVGRGGRHAAAPAPVDVPDRTLGHVPDRTLGHVPDRALGHVPATAASAATPARRHGDDARTPSAAPEQPDADLRDTEIVALPPVPSRHELRAAHQHRRRVSRPAVVAGLAMAVVAAPLTGFATSSPSAQAVGQVETGVNLFDLLDARSTELALASTGTALMANPTAPARAMAIAGSRASERNELDTTHLTSANGESAAFVEPAQVVMPIAAGSYRNTSGYGPRQDPFHGGTAFHPGTDFAARLGTPIHAVADGVVDYVGVGKDGRSSMLVVLRHEIDGETVYTWYNHMFADGVFVEEGQEVRAGDVIAQVGNNGRSTGPHLHFEVHLDAELTTTEPLAWLAEQGAIDVSELR